MQQKQKVQFSPILFYLQNNKIADLIRVMFNCNLSQQYLIRYGKEKQSKIPARQLSKIQDYTKFNIIYLKGSNQHKIIDHTNSFLKMCLAKKIQENLFFKPEERKLAWMQLTNFYQMPLLFKELDQFQIPQVLIQTIAKDVTRTQLSEDILKGCDEAQINKKNIIMRIRLTNILQKFAVYNPYVGYCQGMNNLVLFFLQQGFDEQSSFFLLKKITQEILPCDYYITMNTVHAFVKLLCEVLTQTHPKVVQVMKRVAKNNGGEGIVLITGFTIQWFVCLFSNTNLQRDMRRCIFDHFLLQGLPALLKASLCYFDAIEPQIADANQLQQYHPIVQKTISEYKNIDHLHQCLTQIYINQHLLRLTLQNLTNPVEKSKKSFSKHKCNRSWTTCLQTAQNNLLNAYNHEFFVFKTAAEPKMISNYLQKRNQKGYFNIKNKRKADQVKLGRMEHTCRPTSTTSQTEQSQVFEATATLSSACKSQLSPQSKLSDFSKHYQIFQPQKKEQIRNKALQKLQHQNQSRKTVLQQSQSVKFLKQMIKNQSFNNLIQILEIEQMNNLFKQYIEQDQDTTN